MQHEPGRSLRYADVPVQLHAGHTFQAGQAQVDGDCPFLERDIRPGDSRAGTHAEIATAFPAPVWHGIGVRNVSGVVAPAFTAGTAMGPYHTFKPERGGFLA